MMAKVQSVAEVVAAVLAEWSADAVDVAVFGTSDPDGIAEIVASFCRTHLGAAPAGGLFYLASAGCVVGLRLETGEDIVLKAYQARWESPFLQAVQAVQAYAAAEGFPCARPLLAPANLSGRPNLAVVEAWWPDPGMRAVRTAEGRRLSASGLAALVRQSAALGSPSALAEHPLNSVGGSLYPEPHSPLFDFDASADGAGWIDELAGQAARLRNSDPTPPVVAHTDWSARNVRLGEERLLAIYDWDSVALTPESTAVGQAAATWCVTSEPGGSTFPALDEVVAYLEDYEAATESRFSPAQWRAAGAAAAWVLAYTARCEHSLSATGQARPHQHGARDRLAEDGPALLELRRP
jgi:hypothetical protein